MKKKSKIILSVLMTLPIFIKADMSTPAVDPYNAYVVNPEGTIALCYDGDHNENKHEITIPYETKFKDVMFEVNINNTNYVIVEDYNELNECYIKTSDLEREQKNYDSSNTEKLGEPVEIIISNPKGVEMYSGPSVTYKKVGQTIPYTTILNSKEYNGGYGYTMWYYVDYNNVKGWIRYLYDDVAILSSYIKNMKLYSDIDFEVNNETKTIKKGSTINTFYELNNGGFFIKYKNEYGFIDTLYSESNVEETITTKTELKMYNRYDCSEKNDKCTIITTIPSNVELKYKLSTWGEGSYDMPSSIYTTYDNKEGWVFIDEEGAYKNKVYVKSEYDTDHVEEDLAELNEESTNETNNENTQQTTNNENKKLSTKNTIYLCVGAALIISVTALVTILLMNKKKKKEVPTSEPTTSAPVAPTEPTPVQPEEPKQDDTTK